MSIITDKRQPKMNKPPQVLHYFILKSLSFPTSSDVLMFSLSHLNYQTFIATISSLCHYSHIFHTSSFHGTKGFSYLTLKNQNQIVKLVMRINNPVFTIYSGNGYWFHTERMNSFIRRFFIVRCPPENLEASLYIDRNTGKS